MPERPRSGRSLWYDLETLSKGYLSKGIQGETTRIRTLVLILCRPG